jgi:hypothetical protein
MVSHAERVAQRRWDTRRAKRQLQLRLTPDVLEALRATARERRMPISELAERFIRAGLERGAARTLEETALPAVAEAVRLALEAQARRSEERLAKLLTGAILTGDITRRLVFASLVQQWGREQIQPVHDAARTAAIDALRQKGWAAALRLDVEDVLE